MDLSKYILKENSPREGQYLSYWVSVFNTETMDRITSFQVEKTLKAFNEIEKLTNVFENEEKEFFSNISTELSNAEYYFRYEGDKSKTFEFEKEQYSFTVSISYNKKLFKEEYSKFEVKALEKTSMFFSDLAIEFKLNEHEMNFLFPKYESSILLMTLFFENYRGIAKRYVESK